MNKPFFNEEDIKDFFGEHQKIEVQPKLVPEKQPAPKPQPPINPSAPLPYTPQSYPPLPQPGAIPQVQTSFASDFSPKKDPFYETIAKFLGLFIVIFVLSFVIINGPALWLQGKYFWTNDVTHQSWTTNYTLPTPIVTQSRLLIPKIKVDVPIIWNIAEDDINRNLENGAVHYKDTALPGQVGNIFITGHSSYYFWAPGDYKDVFALLPQLEPTDKIYIQYNGVTFTYQVNEIKTVYPTDLDVLNQTKDKTLSLMTCVPVGTNLQRLVVTAKQIPD